MQHDAMVTSLKSLKLFGMAQAVAELAQQGAPAYQNAQNMLGDLLKAEMAEREVRSVAYQMKIARFPTYRDLAGFDFTQSPVNEALVRQLHRCEFLEQAYNIVLVGGPGTGKTHLATALGVCAAKKRHRVVMRRAADLVRELVEGHESVARTIRGVYVLADEANDQPTADLLTQRLQIHEKTAWMLRSLLEG